VIRNFTHVYAVVFTFSGVIAELSDPPVTTIARCDTQRDCLRARRAVVWKIKRDCWGKTASRSYLHFSFIFSSRNSTYTRHAPKCLRQPIKYTHYDYPFLLH